MLDFPFEEQLGIHSTEILIDEVLAERERKSHFRGVLSPLADELRGSQGNDIITIDEILALFCSTPTHDEVVEKTEKWETE
jgi:hypothetical protein